MCLIMVLKWLLRKKTLSSPSRARAVSSHSPWKVSCDAVASRNCSATSPEGTAGTEGLWRGWGRAQLPPRTAGRERERYLRSPGRSRWPACR